MSKDRLGILQGKQKNSSSSLSKKLTRAGPACPWQSEVVTEIIYFVVTLDDDRE